MALAGLILGYVGGILFIALVAVLIAFWVHLWSKVTGGGGGNYVPQVPSLPSP